MKHLSMALALTLMAFSAKGSTPGGANDARVLRWKPPEEAVYLVERNLTRVDKHKDNEEKLLRERAVVDYRAKVAQETGDITVLSLEGDLAKEGIYRLKKLRPGAKKYPEGRLTRFAGGDSPPGRPWTLLEVAGLFEMFPILSRQSIRPGDEWNARLQVSSPSNYKHVFPLDVQHRLARYEVLDGRTCAVIEYRLCGALRTAEHPEMLADDLVRQFRPAYTVSGEGTAYLDAQGGIIVRKEQEINWTKKWTGRLDPRIVTLHPNWEVDVNQLNSSRISMRLISGQHAAELIKQAKQRRPESTLRPGPDGPAAEWTYAVSLLLEHADVHRNTQRAEALYAIVTYSAGRPSVTYTDQTMQPLPLHETPDRRLHPLPRQRLSLAQELPAFAAPDTGKGWPVDALSRALDVVPMAPEDGLSPGKKWRRGLQVAVRGLPFTAQVRHHCQGYEWKKNRRCLEIDYTLGVDFKSCEDPKRFDVEDPDEHRAEICIRANGVVYYDPQADIIIEKRQTTSWTWKEEQLRRLADGSAGWVVLANERDSVEIVVERRPNSASSPEQP